MRKGFTLEIGRPPASGISDPLACRCLKLESQGGAALRPPAGLVLTRTFLGFFGVDEPRSLEKAIHPVVALVAGILVDVLLAAAHRNLRSPRFGPGRGIVGGELVDQCVRVE